MGKKKKAAQESDNTDKSHFRFLAKSGLSSLSSG